MTCPLCGGVFTPSRFNRRQRYCSPNCRQGARRQYKRAYDRRWRDRHPHYMRRYLTTYRAETNVAG